jgi:hypothetical protein
MVSALLISTLAVWLGSVRDGSDPSDEGARAIWRGPFGGTLLEDADSVWRDAESGMVPLAARKPESGAAEPAFDRAAAPRSVIPVADKPKPFADSPVQLWRRWEKALVRGDFQQIPIVGGLLAERLRRYPDEAVYRDIARFLSQADLPIESKSILVDLLGEIATPEALTQLIGLAQGGPDAPLYVPALQVISRIGENRWDGRFHEELSPDLEAAWSSLTVVDPAYAAAIARALATIGAPSGLNLLFQALAESTKKTHDEETTRLKQTTAFSAIPAVRNPDATEVLNQWFQETPLGSPAFEVGGLALAGLGSLTATQILLEWAQTAPAEGASRVVDWFTRLHDSASVDWLVSVQNSLEFQSNSVEKAFTTALAQIDPQQAAMDVSEQVAATVAGSEGQDAAGVASATGSEESTLAAGDATSSKSIVGLTLTVPETAVRTIFRIFDLPSDPVESATVDGGTGSSALDQALQAGP